MKAVILVGHGSRKKESNEQFTYFAEMVAEKTNTDVFRYAFLELAQPSIIDEITLCVEKGAKEIILFPLLLLTAGHAKHDIPNEVAKAKKMFPAVQMNIESPLGIQSVLIAILTERLAEKEFRKKDSLVVFVGRGSYDEQQIKDFEKITMVLRKQLEFPHIKASFLVGGSQSYIEALNEAKASEYKKVYVLPYLLFRGLLLKGIAKEVAQLNDERFILCDSIGIDAKLVQLVSQLINDKVKIKRVI